MIKIKKNVMYGIIALVIIAIIGIVAFTSLNTAPRAADELVINAQGHTGEPEGVLIR